MPPTARFDEYERCLYGSENLSLYCMVRTTIKPNNESDLWRYIKVSLNNIYFFRMLQKQN